MAEKDNTKLIQIIERSAKINENNSMEIQGESQIEYEKRIEQTYQAEEKTLVMNNGKIEEKEYQTFLAAFLKKKGKEIDLTKLLLHNPACVCVSESHEIVFVSTTGDSSITMLDLDGQCKGKIANKELKSPWGMVIQDDTIYVTDIEARSVFSFSISQQTVI